MSKLLRLSITMLLLVGLAGCGHKAEEKKEEGKDEAADVKVRAEPAAMRRITDSIVALGRCEALPQNLAVLTAAAEGRVTRMLVQPGEQVKAGQPIVELDATVARANLKEKQSARDSQEASLKLLESLPRAEEQDSAKLAIEQAKVAVEKARLTADRLKPLRERSEVSESAMYEADTALKQAELQLKAAQAQYHMLMLRPRPQAIEEARSKVAVAEAAVATAQAQVDQLTIRSPIDGALDSLMCQVGQTLSVGTAVGQVVSARQVHAVVWVAVADAQRIRRGQVARIRGCERESAADKPADAVRGELVFVGKVADPQTGNLPVRVLVDNASGKLTLGQTVTATIVVEERESLAVPATAVHDLGEGTLVNVVREGKTAHVGVKTGRKDGDWIEITEAELKPGEAVIVEGGYNLPEETKVEVKGDDEKKESDEKKGTAKEKAESKAAAENEK